MPILYVTRILGETAVEGITASHASPGVGAGEGFLGVDGVRPECSHCVGVFWYESISWDPLPPVFRAVSRPISGKVWAEKMG